MSAFIRENQAKRLQLAAREYLQACEKLEVSELMFNF